jgi:uncharacterized membrane protein
VADPLNVTSHPERSAEAPAAIEMVAALPRARAVYGDRAIAHVLRIGAVTAGVCFVLSIAAGYLPDTAERGWAVDFFRRSGITLLIVTPVLRLVAAGVLLGMKGEWRYTVFAACILLLLSAAMGAGLSA